MPRKAHSNSVLKTLPEETQARIADWCAQDSLESAVSRCFSELQLKTNKSSMGVFFDWWKDEQERRGARETLEEVFRKADANATAVEQMLAEKFPDATPEKIAAAGQLVFTMQAANVKDAKEFREMEYLRLAKEAAQTKARHGDAKIRQKDRDLKLAERRVVLLEAKAAEAIKTLDDKTLSAPEQAARIREIFKK